ncbi:hypothetical protein TrLO_g7566 [Triparma laevis f. longispina]|uniref:Uncharacterized protein n=1 Tax=Triparma laevis f. longispina TaxID=1714387 RepID=A0A9W6ZWN2_9STRA|nr:hypothetical protein TrLO_g7566 [Triparma laevis f. longispina]
MGGAMRDSGKVSKYKTQHALLLSKIATRKKEFGLEIYDHMYPDYNEKVVKGKLKVVSVKICQWEREVAALDEKINGLNYGKEVEEEVKEEEDKDKEEEGEVEGFEGDFKKLDVDEE